MADQGRWFKLWTTAPADPSLLALPPALRWAWVALGCYTKAHGTGGRLTAHLTNTVLAAEMGVETSAMMETLQCLPHIKIDASNDAFRDASEEGEKRYGTITVTWSNWQKYQEDSTVSERMQRWRERKTLRDKRRREEKRREQKRSSPPTKKNKVLGIATQFPPNFVVTEDLRTWAEAKGLPTPDSELDAFRDHHVSKGNTMRDWTAAFRNWLRRTAQFRSTSPRFPDRPGRPVLSKAP